MHVTDLQKRKVLMEYEKSGKIGMAAAQSGNPQPVLEISFINTLNVCRALWFLTTCGEDLLPPDIVHKLVTRAFDTLVHQSSRPRRHRSCPRAVRQPIGTWPRLLRNVSFTGVFRYEICR